jgi:hypothetical protein
VTSLGRRRRGADSTTISMGLLIRVGPSGWIIPPGRPPSTPENRAWIQCVLTARTLRHGPVIMLRGSVSCLLFVAGVFVACAAPEKAEKLCTPDANVFCRCQDRAEGTKKCKADAQTFEACIPCDGSGDKGPGSGGTDGLGARSGSSSSSGDDDDDDDTTKPTTPTTPTTPVKRDAGDAPNPTTPTENTTPKPKRETTTSSGSSSTDTTASKPDAAHCQPLTNAAPRIEAQKLADVPTAPTGGKPADGLYYQAWVVEFTGENGESGPSKHYSKETLELSGKVGRYVFEDDEGKSEAGGFRLSAVEGKNKVTVAYECPAAPPKDLAYDATDTTIILYDPPYARVFYRQKGTK